MPTRCGREEDITKAEVRRAETHLRCGRAGVDGSGGEEWR